jgi:hypothetical protein
MDRTRQSLQNAIQANKEAQEAVRNELLKISKSKKRNRQTAASLQLKQANNCISMWEEDDSTAITNRPQWTRRFFVDADGNVPLPNEDSKRRVELEKDKDFIHQSPLWSKQEISHFYQFIHNLLHKEVQEEECDESTTVTPPENETKKEVDGVIDFEAVAAAMNEKFPTTHRTVDECRVKYQPNRTAFTKQESLNVLKQHHAHLNNTTDVATPFELSLPDTNRTKWQAFQALHSGALASDKKIPWTVQQDKVLFQTVAASGPQHVMDQHFAHSLSGVLQKHPKAILQRTTTSLLNPSFDNQQWSDTDERRLCLLMKVYRHSQYPFVSVAVRICFCECSGCVVCLILWARVSRLLCL